MPTCGARSSCILCVMNDHEADPAARKAAIKEHIKAIPFLDDDDGDELILVVSGLWKVAMARPDDDELPSLGIFRCMALLLEKSIHDREWLSKNQNIYIPYYAAHIIGSYTMKKVYSAVRAVDSGVIPPLMDLLRGKNMTWVEKRVAIRALGHLASYEKTFMDVALYEGEVVQMAMDMASSCLEEVYNTFVGVEDKRRRLQYHCDLLGRGRVFGGVELENQKAEEWASQLRSWSIHLLNCFAIKERSLNIICKEGFLRELSEMWGGLANNRTSPGGVGLIRIICYSRVGRRYVSKCSHVIENLCNLSRSSDDWQYVAVDCLLLLLKDLDSRQQVIKISSFYLVDLVEVKNLGHKMINIGNELTRALLYDYHEKHQKYSKIKNGDVKRVIEEIWKLKIDKRNRERVMSNESLEQKRAIAKAIKQQGDRKYLVGEVEGAIMKYSEALEICPLRQRKERVAMYSNRGRCHLLMKDADAAISDTTRALCLCRPLNCHGSSLWTRSQAYEMKGMAKESLMDCVFLVNIVCGKGRTVPYYAVRMMSKQMEQTWVFRAAQRKAEESRKQKIRNK